MSALTQEEVPTLSALKAAAGAIPEQVPYQQWLHQSVGEWHQAERAQVAFWRLAYHWIEFTYSNGLYMDLDEGMALIAEVEART